MNGLVLFAHGARDSSWAAPFEAVAALVRARQPGLQVRLAFLEFMAPNLPEACGSLVADGCTHVAIVPMFLGSGGHVRRDLPVMLERARAAHPQVHFHLQPAIGEVAGVHLAMADAIHSTIATIGGQGAAAADTPTTSIPPEGLPAERAP